MPMVKPRVMVLRAPGTNCDQETAFAFEQAGGQADVLHVNRLLENPTLAQDYQILCVPGGFSYGDDVAAGRILGNLFQHHLKDAMTEFKAAGKLILGICNGFQVLVQTGLLPGTAAGPRACTITVNEPPGFQDRWVYLRAATERCVFLEGGRTYELPIAHGEGRVLFADQRQLDAIVAATQNALVYTGPPNGTPNPHGEPLNPNGSAANIAGLCDTTGRVLGLMPHPERFVTWTQHPCWTALPPRPAGDGLAVFRRAVRYFR